MTRHQSAGTLLTFLLYLGSVRYVHVNGDRHDVDTIASITLSLASRYRASCIIFIRDESAGNVYENFQIYKKLTGKLVKMTGMYSYDRYVEATNRDYIDNEELLQKKTCLKPMKLIVDGDGAKEKFTAMTRKYSMSTSVWLIILKRSIRDFLSDALLPFDVELIVARVDNKDLVEFKEVYRVDQEHPLRILDYGRWTRTDGLEIPVTRLYDRRSNLEGKLLKAGAIENWPLCAYIGNVWDGFLPRVWNEVASLLNAKTKYYKGNTSGVLKKSGTWNGLVNMALNGTVDVIAVDLTMSAERMKYIAFSRPIIVTNSKIYFTNAIPLKKWGTVLKPFGFDVWIAIAVWILVGTVAMAFCYKFSWTYGFDTNTAKIFGVRESFFFVLQSFCQQGYPVMPKSRACRFIVLICFLTSSVLVPSYSASIVSTLSRQKPHKPFNSLEQMLRVGTHKLLVLPNSSHYDYFKYSRDPIKRDVLYQLIKTVPDEDKPTNTSQVLEKFFCRSNQYTYLTTEKMFVLKSDYWHLTCPIISLDEVLEHVQKGFGLPKNSSYRGVINYYLYKFFYFGIIQRIENSVRRLRSYKPPPVAPNLSLDDALQIFFVLASGTILSIAFLLMETAHSKSELTSRRSDIKRAPLKRHNFRNFHLQNYR